MLNRKLLMHHYYLLYYYYNAMNSVYLLKEMGIWWRKREGESENRERVWKERDIYRACMHMLSPETPTSPLLLLQPLTALSLLSHATLLSFLSPLYHHMVSWMSQQHPCHPCYPCFLYNPRSPCYLYNPGSLCHPFLDILMSY